MNVKMSCGYYIFPLLEYKAPHENQLGARGIGRNYYFRINQMLVYGKL